MQLRCPECLSEEAAQIDRGRDLECANCGAHFRREEAFVSVADAEVLAEERAHCTCDEIRGCPQCFERAFGYLGETVRDSYGRTWIVLEVGEKDAHPTLCGESFWARPDDVEVLGSSNDAEAT